MKIDPQTPVPQNSPAAGEAERSERSAGKTDLRFSQVLGKKKQDSESRELASTPSNFVDPSLVPAGSLEPAKNPFGQLGEVATPEVRHPVAVPVELQQLVREIAVVVNTPGHQEVHIELNSNVLNGLHIRIERQGTGVGIHFQSSSEQVGSLLSKNMDVLRQGLVERGVEVTGIQVTSPTSESTTSAPDSSTGRQRDFGSQSNQGRTFNARQSGRR